jgi:hypothetical protein
MMLALIIAKIGNRTQLPYMLLHHHQIKSREVGFAIFHFFSNVSSNDMACPLSSIAHFVLSALKLLFQGSRERNKRTADVPYSSCGGAAYCICPSNPYNAINSLYIKIVEMAKFSKLAIPTHFRQSPTTFHLQHGKLSLIFTIKYKYHRKVSYWFMSNPYKNLID